MAGEKKLIIKRNIMVLMIFVIAPMVLMIRYPLSGQLLVDSGDGAQNFASVPLLLQGLLSGEFPMWNKYLVNGQPANAGGTDSVINILILILGWLPIQWLAFIMYCIHISCAAYFMYLYLQEIECDWQTAFAVAFMLLFSIHLGGFRKSHMGIIWAMSLFPVVMFFIQKYLNTKKMKCIALASGVIAFAFTYAQTQHVTYIATASGIYFVVSMIKNKEKFSRVIKCTAVFAGLFFIFSAVSLLPMLEMIIEYTKNGSSGISFSFFKSFSLNPIVLIRMLFPRFFGENILDKNPYISSGEIDIELFIGVTALVAAIYFIKSYLKKNFQIKLSLVMSLLTLVYMSSAHIPVLCDIVYNMPIFGGFRCQSRMLFVFLFFLYALIAQGLTKLREKDDAALFFRFQRHFVAFLLALIFFAVLIVLACVEIFGATDLGTHTYSVITFVKNRLLPTLIILFVAALIFFIIDITSNKFRQAFTKKRLYFSVTAIICLFTLFETIPYFNMTNASPVTDLSKDDTSMALSANIGNAKIFDAFPGIDGGYVSVITQNKSMRRELPSINAYQPYNNPVLYRLISGSKSAPFNFAGLLTGSLNAGGNIYLQNDLLSMMGVKYIIDPGNLLPDEGGYSFRTDAGTPLFQGISFELAPSINDAQVYAKSIHLKPQTCYMAVIDYSILPQENEAAYAYVDIYDGLNYEPQRHQVLPIDSNHAELPLIVNDVDSTVEATYLRMVSYGLNSPIAVTSLSFYETTQDISKMTYTPFIVNDQARIFENVNACDILYFSQEVKGIEDMEYLFEHQYGLNMDKISYIVGADDKAYDLSGNTITDIDFRYNTITGVVDTENGGFLNFSQSYFPGWRVYIDGRRADLKQVNALIMGVYMPPGIHHVKFTFVRMSFIWGLIITCLGIAVCVVILRRTPKKAQVV